MPGAGSVALGAAFLSAAMMAAFAVQKRTGQSGWIDAIWSLATGIAAVMLVLAGSEGDPGRKALALAMALAWSLRLSGHIAFRTKAAGDDPRYVALRQEWGEKADQRLFLFLQIQALCALPLVLAIAVAAARPGPFPGLQDFAALAIFFVGVWGAARADRELLLFRQSGKGAVCDTGLWQRSRHPNYFFEWVGWWAWPVMAIDFSGSHLAGLAALGAPAMIYWLLVHASGIPPLEAHMLRSRGAAYQDYQQRVPAFFPRWRPFN